jgi:hypothetical protein
MGYRRAFSYPFCWLGFAAFSFGALFDDDDPNGDETRLPIYGI